MKNVDKVLNKVLDHENKRTPVCYINEELFVKGEGYRVCIVIAGEDGYRPTGDWPYTGEAGQKMPWFWGPTLEAAQKQADEQNRCWGVSPEEALLIVARSMARSGKRRVR